MRIRALVIVFAMAEASKKDLARVRKKFREKMFRSRCKVVYQHLTVRATARVMMIRTLVARVANLEATL